MTLKYYHAEPAANSLKSMIPLIEKGLPFQSVYVDLHKFEQHADWFVAINPEGQVPVLDHDGVIITHTTVSNEYLEDVFPDTPLRPRDPVGAARMRYWNKFCDEQVMNYVSIHGWHRMVSIIARSIESDEFERLMQHIPLPDQRRKWRAARSGFSEADLAHATEKILFAVDKVEKQLAQTAWIAGDEYTLADINFYSYCGMSVERMFPELAIGKRCPRLIEWRGKKKGRPPAGRAPAGGGRARPRGGGGGGPLLPGVAGGAAGAGEGGGARLPARQRNARRLRSASRDGCGEARGLVDLRRGGDASLRRGDRVECADDGRASARARPVGAVGRDRWRVAPRAADRQDRRRAGRGDFLERRQARAREEARRRRHAQLQVRASVGRQGGRARRRHHPPRGRGGRARYTRAIHPGRRLRRRNCAHRRAVDAGRCQPDAAHDQGRESAGDIRRLRRHGA